MDGTRDGGTRDGRSGDGASGREPPSAPRPARKRWAAPRIAHHGSIRHLIRGISGFLADSFGMPGMRKV